jgi:hypothetical protein
MNRILDSTKSHKIPATTKIKPIKSSPKQMPSRKNPSTNEAEEEVMPNKVIYYIMQENSKQEEIDRRIQEKAQEEAEQIIE